MSDQVSAVRARVEQAIDSAITEKALDARAPVGQLQYNVLEAVWPIVEAALLAAPGGATAPKVCGLMEPPPYGYDCEQPVGHKGPHGCCLDAYDEEGKVPSRHWPHGLTREEYAAQVQHGHVLVAPHRGNQLVLSVEQVEMFRNNEFLRSDGASVPSVAAICDSHEALRALSSAPGERT
jgi:hypothetical protein